MRYDLLSFSHLRKIQQRYFKGTGLKELSHFLNASCLEFNNKIYLYLNKNTRLVF